MNHCVHNASELYKFNLNLEIIRTYGININPCIYLFIDHHYAD